VSNLVNCTTCGRLLHTGEALMLVAFSAAQLAKIANDVLDVDIRRRVLCALGLIDQDAAEACET
jgi:hypothetical protein